MDTVQQYLELVAKQAELFSSLNEESRSITSKRIDGIAEADVSTVANIGFATLYLLAERKISISKLTRDSVKKEA